MKDAVADAAVTGKEDLTISSTSGRLCRRKKRKGKSEDLGDGKYSSK